VDELVKQCAGVKIDAVAGVESRGFLFGFSMAMKLGVPFVLIRKKGKLPAETVSYKYDLEYGSAEIEMHVDAVEEGMHVLIHDDLLATGGTAVAAAELIQKSGGKVAGFSFVVELSFLKGKEVLNKYSEYNKSIVNY
jgi:adenine phosphoribosyltransferase